MTSAYNEKIKLYEEFEKDAIPSMDILYNFALRMTGSKKKAKKLLVETYKKAFWFFGNLDKSIEVKGWLFRVMRNAFLNKYSIRSDERTKIESERVEHLYENLRTGSTGINQIKEIINKKLTDNKLSKILSSIPEDLRFVIVLCDIHGLNYEEISDFVDVPVGVVVSRLRRGRKIIFTELYKTLVN